MLTQTEQNFVTNDERTIEAMERAQRSAYYKGVVALIGVVAGIAFLVMGFTQMATV